MKEQLDKKKSGKQEGQESAYMKLVEEEKNLFRIPKNLDPEAAKKKLRVAPIGATKKGTSLEYRKISIF